MNRYLITLEGWQGSEYVQHQTTEVGLTRKDALDRAKRLCKLPILNEVTMLSCVLNDN